SIPPDAEDRLHRVPAPGPPRGAWRAEAAADVRAIERGEVGPGARELGDGLVVGNLLLGGGRRPRRLHRTLDAAARGGAARSEGGPGWSRRGGLRAAGGGLVRETDGRSDRFRAGRAAAGLAAEGRDEPRGEEGDGQDED